MPGWRPERVGEMVHRELAERLRQVKDPELTEVSITGVDMSRDLSRAVVRYLPFGGGDPSRPLQEALERAGRQIRGPIGRALRLRTAPELVFSYDKNHEDAVRLTALLDEISRQHGTSDRVPRAADAPSTWSGDEDAEGSE